MTINLDFRPRSLFWPLSAETHLLSTIKGAERRAMVESILNAGDLEALNAFITKSALDHDERTAFGRLHPAFMGGEYLPDLEDGEIEVARINIASTTSDVTSVYAHRTPKGIGYRVVDEYNGETLSGKTTRFSKQPLTLGELTDFFLKAWPLEELLDMNELDRDGSQRFVRPSSALYPEFTALIRQKIREWRPE
jgi:hypothetical protein